ncbi:MAG: SDR family NAD(P)-dependent oxidoreductase [Burkholderiaceae bacterium]|nr:SDR family NAD(P)-dependent oxidoreductase [Burkholderiaceae bacterium]
MAIAACRADAFGILDLGVGQEPAQVRAALIDLTHASGNSKYWGVRWDALGAPSGDLARLAEMLGGRTPVPLLVLAGIGANELASARDSAKRLGHQVLLEVQDLPAARAAQTAGYDGVIVKGHEAGGRVSQRSSLILLQEFHAQLGIPYWIQGGVGLHSAAAAVLSGAAGVVLCDQLWLAAEGPFGASQADTSWHHLDGSETVLIGGGDAVYRFSSRSGRARLRELDMAVVRNEPWAAMLHRFLAERDDGLLPVGQDIAFAASLAKHYGTVGRIVTAVRESITSCIEQAHAQTPLAPNSPLATLHGTRFPIVQGPMTRVSDVGAFAQAVAEQGALPFLALAVMRGPQIRTMLAQTIESIGAAPWGVGLLGFMPLALRQEQINILREVKPPFAIIAGGRPSQARELDELGITTYLHVPSPGLLRGFLAEGARRFVFEGSECGGHTGPRTSFILWESAIDILTSADIKDPESVQVLFAGGIHDALSAAMVSVLSAPLVMRGMKVGVLMGTAYLFTEEIVRAEAIVPEFQRQAVACQETALLQSGVGIYTRCAKTPFCDEFDKVRRELVLASKSDEETLMALELMNIGRLRIAAKGITRNSDPNPANGAERYVSVDSAAQVRDGVYMLGDVARLRNSTCSIAALHASVSIDSVALLRRAKKTLAKPARIAQHDDIAIVGMACLFPGAQGLRQYWQNILRGVDAIREVTDDRWRTADLFDPKRGNLDKVYSKWGGFLDDIAFDPQTYGIVPASLAAIEPAQLLSLEVARRALADAGFDRRPFARERTAAIFAVGGMNDLGTFYNFRTLLPHYLNKIADLPEQTRQHIIDTLNQNELPKWSEDTFPGILGNVVAGRIANRLDLGGTNLTVDAACAASLAALDVGIMQLRNGDADVALVGGVDCTNSPIGFMCFAQTHALSPHGRSRPFDQNADGIAISEGVGAVVLKRLADAERDGDRIYALIKGIGSSSDGRNRGLTAPHPPGQVRALRRAYQDAGVDTAEVTLIEAHGTGTALGDKSEIESLNLAFAAAPARQECAVGSVKSMIGHTKIAAGMAGLIKAALALQHRILPPTLGVDQPTDSIDAARSPFYLNTEARPWLHEGRDHARHCGVSAFGFGGTNFHTVLAEYTGAYRAGDAISLNPREVEIFAFAGATRAEIDGAVRSLLQGLEYAEQIDLAQLAYSLYREQHVIRRANGGQPCRLTLIAASVGELKQKLAQVLELLAADGQIRQVPGLNYRESVDDIGRVCFLFPGQGSQKVNMLRDLVVALPELHQFFKEAGHPGAEPSQAISRVIYPVPAFTNAERNAQQQALNATEIAQPALGMVGMAAFSMLTDYGLHPDFVAGHSYGEYVALCAAGAITRDDLMRLSHARGRLAAAAPQGMMAALDIDGERVSTAIARHGLSVHIANFNAPNQTIIAGTVQAIDAASKALGQDGLRVKKLAVSAAFHCDIMAGVREALASELAKIRFQAPRIPVYSNTSAAPYPQAGGQLRALLARHIAEPVRFADEINALYADGARVFIECGPGLVLSTLVANILANRPHITLAIDAPGRSGWLQLAQLLTQAQSIGLPVNLAPWFGGRGLDECGLDAVFAQARQRAKPMPLAWRVNGGRAAPWYAPPAKRGPADTAPQQVAAIRSSCGTLPPQPLTPLSINNRRNAMKAEDIPDVPAAMPQAAASYGREALVAQVQNNIGRLLDLQYEQQLSLRHFLTFQAQLAGVEMDDATALGGRRATEPPSFGATPNTHQPAAAPVSGLDGLPAMLGIAPRAPILPKQLDKSPVAETPAIASRTAPVEVQGAAPDVASSGQFKADLLRAVAERTGYPMDMLDLDAHMEADLGIDSIKRIEIFSGLTSRYSLLGERDEEAVIEELSGLKSLNQIIAWYEQMLHPAAAAEAVGGTLPKKALTPPSPHSETVESDVSAGQADPVQCYVVQASPAQLDAAAASIDLPTRFPILLVGPESTLSAALHRYLACRGHQVRQLIPGAQARALDELRCEADLSSLQSVRQLGELLVAEHGEPIGALINLMGATDQGDTVDRHLGDARALFLLLKVWQQDLKASARSGAGWLINVTAFDGQFGLGRSRAFLVGSAGTLGVAKSAAREWPTVRVKCIDLEPGLEPDWVADQIYQEMCGADRATEVGLTARSRWRIDLKPSGSARQHLSELTLDAGAVLLVTGGAYGITADMTRALAEKYRLRLIVVGRSTLPGEEAELTRGIADTTQLKQILIHDLRSRDPNVTPAQVSGILKGLLKDRQIRTNLAAMRASGAELEYHCLDVRDTVGFANLIDDVYARWGRIDGVLHGAGVIGDKLIGDKPVESFDAVFDTKVLPALVLADKLRSTGLKFIAFFSSVAGRFGNIGQCDYSAANEILNKLADRLRYIWPEVHAVSINWGPWDAGMVNDDLRKLYATRSIRPIPAAVGLRHFMEELERGAGGESELVISSSVRQISALQLGR